MTSAGVLRASHGYKGGGKEAQDCHLSFSPQKKGRDRGKLLVRRKVFDRLPGIC